jgi:hypothetical protein
MKKQIEQDIWDWIKSYIEADHEFYNYKFPPCPYAKAARLKGLVNVTAYESGSISQFIKNNIESTHNVKVLVLPPKVRWYYHIHWLLKQLNKKLIPLDRYVQYGKAATTDSRYAGLKGPYFIIIVNVLSDVIAGHRALSFSDYYKDWDKHHYDSVVVRRNKMIEQYDR